MSKAIKVTDEVYIALDAIRVKGETFSDAVEKAVKVYVTIKDVSDTLGPRHYLKSKTPPGQDPFREAILDRRDLEARTL